MSIVQVKVADSVFFRRVRIVTDMTPAAQTCVAILSNDLPENLTNVSDVLFLSQPT